jgi:hypothetical protein
MKSKPQTFLLFTSLLSLLLGSCSASTTPPLVVKPSVTSTHTHAPTNTLTITPSPTESPTPTPGPNAPEGWTRKEGNIYYRDEIEDGKKVSYLYKEFRSADGKVEFGAWISDHAVNKNYVFHKNDDPYLDMDLWPERFLFIYGVKGPMFKNPDAAGAFVANNYSDTYYHALRKGKFSKLGISGFFDAVASKSLSVEITTPDNVFIWHPTDKVGIDWIVVPWDSFNTENYPGVHIWDTMDYNLRDQLTYRWAVFLQSNDNLAIVGSVQNPENLTDDQWARLLYGSFVTATIKVELPEEIAFFSSPFLSDLALNSERPNIKIIR